MSTNATLIEKYPLEKRKILKKTVQKLYGSLTLLFILFLYLLFNIAIPFKFTSMLLFLFAAFFFLTLLLFILVYIYETFYFKNYFYDITEEGLIIKKGVFSTKKSIIPLNKIQDVYLDQDIFDKIFGLWDLHISSATETSGFEAHIDGVNEINGRKMRDLLLGKTLQIQKEIVAEKYFPVRAGLILIAIMGLSSALRAVILIGWPFAYFFLL